MPQHLCITWRQPTLENTTHCTDQLIDVNPSHLVVKRVLWKPQAHAMRTSKPHLMNCGLDGLSVALQKQFGERCVQLLIGQSSDQRSGRAHTSCQIRRQLRSSDSAHMYNFARAKRTRDLHWKRRRSAITRSVPRRLCHRSTPDTDKLVGHPHEPSHSSGNATNTSLHDVLRSIQYLCTTQCGHGLEFALSTMCQGTCGLTCWCVPFRSYFHVEDRANQHLEPQRG